jgi:hypothetical protein
MLAITHSLGIWLALGFEERINQILVRKSRGYVPLAEPKTRWETNLTMNFGE